ncbi:LADA_0D04654g1_1 [Lachancea dasiensis]|uniref:LADA_0D04654g1_1 n=1 Tax=Lachancea dasiensis TaxID=1072105 RepID=A0A1G4J572_9SACH|nr:LADA_0D04654g1_1 [Lachancea dasiensis]
MVYLIYTNTGHYNNGNFDWLGNLLQQHHRGFRYIGIAALTALSVYILTPSLFGSRDKDMFSSSKRSDKYTTGLINNRNDCFANSSVQALSALPKLTAYMNDFLKQANFLRTLLDRANDKQGVNSGEDSHDTGPVSHADERSNSLEDSLAPGAARTRPNLLRPQSNLQRFSSTATITTMSTLEDERNSHNHGVATGETSAAHSVYSSSLSKDLESTASSEEIPELPMHEGLAQIMYQLQQLVTSNKYVSVWPFLRVLETIFDAKISSGQNDAHELTQVILETLEKENLKLKKFVKSNSLNVIIPDFPVKGSLADHLVCLSCQGSSKVNKHPFTMYSLPVPQEVSADLSAMIADNQTETIDGYACLSCRIKAILANEETAGDQSSSNDEKLILETLSRILPDIFINDDLSEDLLTYINNYKKGDCDASSIRSRIVKKTVVTESPDLLILHLSRSVFNGTSYSRNACYVNFDEELHTQEQTIENNRCVGIKPVKYVLRAMVKHQGTHSQGHYESYRRKPDLIKDVLSNHVVNRSPTIDFGLDSNRDAADAWTQSANISSSDVSSNSSQESVSSPSVPFRSVFPESTPEMPLSTPVVDDDDYIVGRPDSGSSSAPSRKPSRLKKLTGFLSRRSSVASPPEPQNRDSITEFDPARVTGRSRVNSVTSVDSSNWGFTSGADTSASENDEPASAVERKLKKIKSVINYPFWKISDAAVREAKKDEVLGDTKYVYMLYYERVDES